MYHWVQPLTAFSWVFKTQQQLSHLLYFIRWGAVLASGVLIQHIITFSPPSSMVRLNFMDHFIFYIQTYISDLLACITLNGNFNIFSVQIVCIVSSLDHFLNNTYSNFHWYVTINPWNLWKVLCLDQWRCFHYPFNI